MSVDPQQLTGGIQGAINGAQMGAAGGPITGALGAIGGGALGWFSNKKAKAPAPPTGAEAGQWAADYYNKAFPGTTAWERLGTSNPAGGIAEGTMSTQTSASNTNAQLSQQRQQMHLANAIEIGKLQIERQKAKNDTQRTANETAQVPSKIDQQSHGTVTQGVREVLKKAGGVGESIGNWFYDWEHSRGRRSSVGPNMMQHLDDFDPLPKGQVILAPSSRRPPRKSVHVYGGSQR